MQWAVKSLLKLKKNYKANPPIPEENLLGKIYERIIYKYLVQDLNAKQFFNEIQAGFSKGRSPQEHLFRLAQDVSNSFKGVKITIANLFSHYFPVDQSRVSKASQSMLIVSAA